MPKDKVGREKTYPLNTVTITAINPDDSALITIISMTIKPDMRVANAKEHQARIYELTTRLTDALDRAGIGYETETITLQASERDRLNYNDNVVEAK
ncbi:hypothetical protein LCGC14_1301680 [marine sediment metagenome]|uniref:Uncharacterized protein n=1 Tax=marine sediment metagenome TaxID=412755 RepID=A0A0F9LA39_9ZZZZ